MRPALAGRYNGPWGTSRPADRPPRQMTRLTLFAAGAEEDREMTNTTASRSWVKAGLAALCALLGAALTAAAIWASPAVTLTDANDFTNPVVYTAGPLYVPNIPPPILRTPTSHPAHPPARTTPTDHI